MFVVWDEAIMTHVAAVEAVHCLFLAIHNAPSDAAPFAGVPFLLVGDSRQVLPVVRHGTNAAIVSAVILSSNLWNHVQLVQLTINERVNQRNYEEIHTVLPTLRNSLRGLKTWVMVSCKVS